jgi:hypothetical protein
MSDGLPIFTEFHGLNLEDSAVNIKDADARRCHNCDLSDGIELLTDFNPSYGRPVTWQDQEFSISSGQVMRDGVILGVAQPDDFLTGVAFGAGSGTVEEGRYEFLMTYLNADDEEGIGSNSETVEADEDDRIQLTWGTTPSGIAKRRIYCRGGPQSVIEFSLVGELGPHTTSIVFTTLEIDPTQGIYTTGDQGVPPTGVDYVFWNNARLYLVVDNKVYYSGIADLHYGFADDAIWELPEEVTGIEAIREDVAIAWAHGVVNIAGLEKTELMKRETNVTQGPSDFLTFISVGGPILYLKKSEGIFEFDGNAEKKVSRKINPLFPLTGTIRAAWDGRYYALDSGLGMDFERGDFFTFDRQLQNFNYTTKEYTYDMVANTGPRLSFDYSGSPRVLITRDGFKVEGYALPYHRIRDVENRWFPKGRFQRVSLTFSGGADDKIHAWGFKR